MLGRICEEFGCLPFRGGAAEQPLALLNDIMDMRAYVKARQDIRTPGKSDYPDDEAHEWAKRVLIRRRTGRWVWG